MLRYMTIAKFSIESGYTENAIRSKIRDGIWSEGCVWIKAPDGRNLIDVRGYESWVETGQVFKVHRRAAAKPLPIAVASTEASALLPSPPPLV